MPPAESKASASSSEPATIAPAVPIRAARLRTSVQIIGFLIGLALLAWCVSIAAKPENVSQWSRLRHAPAGSVALLLGLSIATMLVNGATFHCSIRPVKQLGAIDLQAVNAAASLLAYLPFKLSLLYRILIHNRRDRLPLLTIAAWFSAIAAVLAVAILPPLGAAIVRGRADGVWWAMALGGVAVSATAMIVVARILHDGPGWLWLERMWKRCRFPKGLLPRAHEGLRMLADVRAVVTGLLLRLFDVAIHTCRFLVAASILGFDLPLDKAVIAGCSYFIIGTAAPSGSLGLREALTGGLLGKLLAGLDPDQFMVAVLMVTAAEVLTLIPAAIAAAAWTKPWKLRTHSSAKQSHAGSTV